MQRIELKLSGSSGTTGVLYPAERPDSRLLVWIGPHDGAEGSQPANSLTGEGWNVLHTGIAPGRDDAATIAGIVGALTAAMSHVPKARIVAVADGTSVPAACAAVLETYRRDDVAAIGGLVVVDAVPDMAAAVWASLSGLSTLTTLIAARQPSREARQSGLACHRQLQVLGRDTHFMVLAETGRSLAAQLADPRDVFGREVRWLLDPVNSRTD
jgi:hypothetical protein